MQLRLPWASREASTDARRVVVNGHAHDLVIARHGRARRYVLRVLPSGVLRLTVPRGASIAGGLAFVSRQSEWIDREQARQRRRSAGWDHGSVVLYRGNSVALHRDDGVIVLADVRVDDDGRNDVRGLVEARLLEIASDELPVRCLALACEHGLAPDRVTVRAQRARWGACSARGRITLNWRLIHTPPGVSDYVLLHELAHLRVRNHSSAFWREVERLCPWWRESEAWLRRRGSEIL